jgi:hypothetical protein
MIRRRTYGEAFLLTLATAPTKTDTAPSNWEALHLLNGTFRIGFTHKLNEAAMLPNRNFNLWQTCINTGIHAQGKGKLT